MLIIYKEENYVLICSLSWILSTKFDLMLKVLFLVEIDENSLDSCGKKTPIFPWKLMKRNYYISLRLNGIKKKS